MKTFVLGLVTLALSAHSASAQGQTPYSGAELVWCASLYETAMAVDDKWQAEDGRRQRMSVNGRSSSSIDRYNDQVAITNWIDDYYRQLFAEFKAKCTVKLVRKADQAVLCSATILGKNMADSRYCKDVTIASGAAPEGETELVEFTVPDPHADRPPAKYENFEPRN